MHSPNGKRCFTGGESPAVDELVIRQAPAWQQLARADADSSLHSHGDDADDRKRQAKGSRQACNGLLPSACLAASPQREDARNHGSGAGVEPEGQHVPSSAPVFPAWLDESQRDAERNNDCNRAHKPSVHSAWQAVRAIRLR